MLEADISLIAFDLKRSEQTAESQDRESMEREFRSAAMLVNQSALAAFLEHVPTASTSLQARFEKSATRLFSSEQAQDD